MSDPPVIEDSSQSTTQHTAIVNKNAEALKSRIIATSKLINYVHTAKTDLEEKNAAMAQLENKLKEVQQLADERLKKCDELSVRIEQAIAGSHYNDNNKKISDLEKKVASAEESKSKAEEALKGQKMYIEQLEARSKQLEEDSKKASETTKVTDRVRNEMNKKTEELRKAHKELALREKKIQDLESEIAVLKEAKETLEEDSLESTLNAEMMKQENDDMKEEKTKMETKLQEFIDEVSTLKERNNALTQQNEELRQSTKSLPSSRRQSSASASSSSIKSQTGGSEQQLQQIDSLRNGLYLAEAQCQLAQDDNKLLRAKLTRLMARQRMLEDASTKDDILKRAQYTLDSSSDNEEEANISLPGAPLFSESVDYKATRRGSLNFTPYPQAKRKSSSGSSGASLPTHRSPLSPSSGQRYRPHGSPSTAPAQARLHSFSPPSTYAQLHHPHHSPPSAQTSPSRSLMRSNSGLIMPPSLIIPTKAKPTGSNSKKSKLEKFVKNPSKYATKSTSIPLTPVNARDLSPKDLIPEGRATETHQEEATSRMSRQSSITEITLPSATTTSQSIASSISSVLQKRSRDNSEDEEDDLSSRTSKTIKLDGSIEAIVERILAAKKLPPKEELRKFITEEGLTNLISEISDYYHHIKSTVNPMPKTKKQVTYKAHGLRPILMVNVPDNLDKKEKNIIWFVRMLITQFISDDICSKIKTRLQSVIMTILHTKKTDNAVYRLLRLLTALCKETYDSKFLFRLSFDICRYAEVDQHILMSLLNIVYIWNDGLVVSPSAEMGGKGTQMLGRTVQRVASHIANKEGATEQNKNLYSTTASISKWPEMGEDLYQLTQEISKVFNATVMEEIQEASQVIYDDLRCCIVNCIEMIFYYLQDWNVLFDKYIRSVLWPMLNEDVVDDIALELLGILGVFGLAKEEGMEDQQGVSALIARFESLIEFEGEVAEDIKRLQETAKIGKSYLKKEREVQLPKWV